MLMIILCYLKRSFCFSKDETLHYQCKLFENNDAVSKSLKKEFNDI